VRVNGPITRGLSLVTGQTYKHPSATPG
jgi:hypothetical protein